MPPARYSVADEWSPLRRVMLGRADTLSLPLAALQGSHGRGLAARDYASANRMARTRCGFEQGRLVHALRAHGVEIRTPRALPAENSALGQLFVRDPFMIIGHRLLAAAGMGEVRRSEQATLEAHLPCAESRPAPAGACLEGGDVLLDLPRVYVGLGHRSNIAGAHWLAGELCETVEVVPVPFASAVPTHLDCCLALTGPGRGIVYRPAFPRGLPAPLDDYDLIEVDGRTFAERGVNVLAIDEQTLVIQARHVGLRERLVAQGLTPLTIEFDQHAALGGGFRCASLAMWRGAV